MLKKKKTICNAESPIKYICRGFIEGRKDRKRKKESEQTLILVLVQGWKADFIQDHCTWFGTQRGDKDWPQLWVQQGKVGT